MRLAWARKSTPSDGTQDKQEFHNYSREEVLTIGERDIKSNWSRYRVAYEQEKAR